MASRQREYRVPLRVLVVEDEILIAMDVEGMLSQVGCVVIGPVPTVAEALALLEREKPDAALLDVQLRQERSAAVAEALLRRGVPFALATAYPRRELQEAAFQNAPMIGKPLDCTAIRKFLDSSIVQQP